MAKRIDNRVESSIINIPYNKSRLDIRRYLLNIWLTEQQRTQYRYNVEELLNSKWIYIERPAQLNKGCDFKIFVEDLKLYKNGNDKPPSHGNLKEDLIKKKNALSLVDWQLFKKSIYQVYLCKDYHVAYNLVSHLTNIPGWDIECVLKLINWFFIEQDITYWNHTGRDMLWDGINGL